MLNLNSAYYYIFITSLIDSSYSCIIEIQEQSFTNIYIREFDQSEPGGQIKFHVYFLPVG